ncbi:MAG: hypothetical protein AAF730_13815, partial [Bacteroidota bacterium]
MTLVVGVLAGSGSEHEDGKHAKSERFHRTEPSGVELVVLIRSPSYFDMAYDVHDFQLEVIEASQTRPILVDF